jgi:hypothetical protein
MLRSILNVEAFPSSALKKVTLRPNGADELARRLLAVRTAGQDRGGRAGHADGAEQRAFDKESAARADDALDLLLDRGHRRIQVDVEPPGSKLRCTANRGFARG